MKKNFYSDNVSGAAPEILQALVAANAGDTAPYGADPVTEGLQARFAELFETEVEVFPVGTGTAANGLCASIIAVPYGAIYLSDAAHLHGSECGGAEFWSGGNARTIPVPSVDGKIAVADLSRMADEALARAATEVPPRAVSITQGTEASTVYTLAEVRGIAEAARARRLWVHMDGARLANAIARLGCTPAEATWKAGVDVLSFGATKNGALAAEAVVFFNRELAQTMRYRRRRGGHLFSKMRFLSVQLEAFIANGLWLRNARHANAMAQRVREGLAADSRRAVPEPDRDQLRPRHPASARLGRTGRRGLQLLPARRPERGHHPDRMRLRHDGRGGRRPGRHRPPIRRQSTRRGASRPRHPVTRRPPKW